MLNQGVSVVPENHDKSHTNRDKARQEELSASLQYCFIVDILMFISSW